MNEAHWCVRCKVPLVRHSRNRRVFQCCVCLAVLRIPGRFRRPPEPVAGVRRDPPGGPDPESDEMIRVWGPGRAWRRRTWPKLLLPMYQDQGILTTDDPSPGFDDLVRAYEEDR
jgi:hypothetical protein